MFLVRHSDPLFGYHVVVFVPVCLPCCLFGIRLLLCKVSSDDSQTENSGFLSTYSNSRSSATGRPNPVPQDTVYHNKTSCAFFQVKIRFRRKINWRPELPPCFLVKHAFVFSSCLCGMWILSGYSGFLVQFIWGKLNGLLCLCMLAQRSTGNSSEVTQETVGKGTHFCLLRLLFDKSYSWTSIRLFKNKKKTQKKDSQALTMTAEMTSQSILRQLYIFMEFKAKRKIAFVLSQLIFA